jgi:putative DNA primase/helicase
VLPLEGIAAIFGPSGSGKSFLVLDLLAAVASGADWFGCRTKAAPVLYIALEGEAGIAQRVQAYQVKHGRLSAGFRFLLQSLDIRNATDRADLVTAVQAAGWSGGVLCLDTLNRAAPWHG